MARKRNIRPKRTTYKLSPARHLALKDEPSSGPFHVVDLFSGAGGMSFGFFKHPAFKLVAAADAEVGKPSVGRGKLQCNTTYATNIGVHPRKLDLAAVPPADLRASLGLSPEAKIHVLAVCPPCTGFSRANPLNHIRDDDRNSLVRKSAEFALALDVDIVVMENARELIRGNFRHHYELFRQCLEAGGFNVFGRTYFLTRFGLPQVRERAIVVAARARLPLHTLESLWDGWTVEPKALTVRRAFSAIAPHSTGWRVAPQFSSDDVKLRFAAIPRNGGSWLSLANGNGTSRLLTNGMRRILTKGILGSHPDIYGRMAWDKPAPTIKRECAHIGNGRYGHPEQDRLCTVREMAILQGFPNDFEFRDTAVSNMYRHIGDAVPPLISHQLAHLCNWMLTGHQPAIRDTILPNTHLSPDDLHLAPQTDLAYA